MSEESKYELVRSVIASSREYGISNVLFRNAIGSKLGVNVTDMECLSLLFFKGISNPSELSKYTGLSSGSTTAMLDRLEKAGLIIRKNNPNDRRGTLIEVNTDARLRIGPLFKPIREAQSRLLSDYSEEELYVLKDFFNKFTVIYNENIKSIINNI